VLINPARNQSIFRRRFPIRLWYLSQHLLRQNPPPRSQFGSRRRFPRAVEREWADQQGPDVGARIGGCPDGEGLPHPQTRIGHIGSVVGDYYAAEWVTSAWRRENIAYIQSKLNASQLYIEALPAFTRGLVSLPDHPTLLRELRLLERSPTRMGKELVTHPRGCHDDHANSCCAVLHNLSSGVGYDLETLRRAFSTDDNPDPEAQRRVRDQQYRNEFAMRIFQLSGGQYYPR
jgi:hypothetical protein